MEHPIMNLHEGPDTFAELIAATAEQIGLPELYVEKDYWVTLALKHLSQSDCRGSVVFKGGTSLSKAWRLIDRFSEDIDLAIFAQDKGDSARKKLLKNVEATVAQGLTAVADDERISKGSRFRKTVYQYPRHAEGGDFGQASPELLIEVNSFTSPEPFEERHLQTLIAETLIILDRPELIEKYELQSFSVQVLSVSRTLVEKILGVIKDSYHEDAVNKLSGRIRHLYDICQILKHEEYRNFITSSEFTLLCQNCIEDERQIFPKTASLFDTPLADAPLFSQFSKWRPSLETTYTGIFADLVYRDLPPMDDIADTLVFIEKHL